MLKKIFKKTQNYKKERNEKHPTGTSRNEKYFVWDETSTLEEIYSPLDTGEERLVNLKMTTEAIQNEVLAKKETNKKT